MNPSAPLVVGLPAVSTSTHDDHISTRERCPISVSELPAPQLFLVRFLSLFLTRLLVRRNASGGLGQSLGPIYRHGGWRYSARVVFIYFSPRSFSPGVLIWTSLLRLSPPSVEPLRGELEYYGGLNSPGFSAAWNTVLSPSSGHGHRRAVVLHLVLVVRSRIRGGSPRCIDVARTRFRVSSRGRSSPLSIRRSHWGFTAGLSVSLARHPISRLLEPDDQRGDHANSQRTGRGGRSQRCEPAKNSASDHSAAHTAGVCFGLDLGRGPRGPLLFDSPAAVEPGEPDDGGHALAILG